MTGGEPKPRRGPFSASVALSVVLHALVLGAIVLLVRPAPRLDQKRGEPLFVELPNLPAPAPKGNPSERSTQAAPPERAAGAIPPAPAAPPPGAPEVERPAIQEMPAPTPRVASVPRVEAPPVPPMKERVAPVPRPEPRAARPGRDRGRSDPARHQGPEVRRLLRAAPARDPGKVALPAGGGRKKYRRPARARVRDRPRRPASLHRAPALVGGGGARRLCDQRGEARVPVPSHPGRDGPVRNPGGGRLQLHHRGLAL